MLEDEKRARSEALAKRLEARAKFRSQCQLEDWDWSSDRGISKAKFKELCLLNFFHNGENLLLEGKTGAGKTHLAIALGRKLCQQGRSTIFFSTNFFFEEVRAEKASGKYLGFIKKLSRADVVIFDDFGLRNYSHDEAISLQDVLEERYSKGIAIVTSQVSPLGWRGLFEDPVVADSIVDRLRNPALELALTGESYRGKKKSIDPLVKTR